MGVKRDAAEVREMLLEYNARRLRVHQRNQGGQRGDPDAGATPQGAIVVLAGVTMLEEHAETVLTEEQAQAVKKKLLEFKSDAIDGPELQRQIAQLLTPQQLDFLRNEDTRVVAKTRDLQRLSVEDDHAYADLAIEMLTPSQH